MPSDPELVGSLIGVALGFAFILYGYSRCFGPKYPTNSSGMTAPTEHVLPSKKAEKSGKHTSTSSAPVKPSKHVDEFAAWVNPASAKDDTQSSATFKTTYSTAFLALPGREPCEHPRCVATLKGHRSYITAVAFSASGKYIVTCSEDCTTRVWRDVASNTASPPFHTINNGTEFATAACFIQDKYLVLATDETSKLQYYDISKNAQGSLSFQLKFETSHGHDAPVKYLTIAPGTWKFGFTCARGNNDTQLRIISAKGELKHAIKTNQLINHQAKLSHNGQVIGVATKMADCKIHFIDYDASGDFKALQPMCQLRDHKNGVFDVSFTVDGKFAVTGGGDGKWRVFQLPIR
jgi:WD40 repeat protein